MFIRDREDANAHARTTRRHDMHPLRLSIQAQRLKRVFGIDMQTCECGGTIKAIACIEDPSVIKRILDHLDQRETANVST